jgi:thiamine kinase-like enzyme
VDKNNYQDDSDARLKQIANNLEKLHNSNPELFNNRGTFNDYFKYNQRSAKQKQVLDSYWAKYGNKFSI